MPDWSGGAAAPVSPGQGRSPTFSCASSAYLGVDAFELLLDLFELLQHHLDLALAGDGGELVLIQRLASLLRLLIGLDLGLSASRHANQHGDHGVAGLMNSVEQPVVPRHMHAPGVSGGCEGGG